MGTTEPETTGTCDVGTGAGEFGTAMELETTGASEVGTGTGLLATSLVTGTAGTEISAVLGEDVSMNCYDLRQMQKGYQVAHDETTALETGYETVQGQSEMVKVVASVTV